MSDNPLTFREMFEQSGGHHLCTSVNELSLMLDRVITVADLMMVAQNRKIEVLMEVLNNKVGVEHLKNISLRVDTLVDTLNKIMATNNHHHEHPTPPPTIAQLVEAGRMEIECSEPFTENSVAMAVLREDGLYLYDIERNEAGLPIYKNFNKESDTLGLVQALVDVHHARGYGLGQLVHFTVNVLSEEPLNEHSVQRGLVKTQSPQDQ